MISKESQVAKLRSAVAARRDPLTVILARTSALRELPLDDALDRIHDYARAGADALMLPGFPPRGRADIEAAARASQLPLCVLGLPPDVVADTAFLDANRVRIRFLGQPPYRMAVKAIYDSLAHLKEGRDPAELRDREASADVLRAVTRASDLASWERSFEGGSKTPRSE
jgi:2-methylisocitrate lyase-like PEP mutase family enzyme